MESHSDLDKGIFQEVKCLENFLPEVYHGLFGPLLPLQFSLEVADLVHEFLELLASVCRCLF